MVEDSDSYEESAEDEHYQAPQDSSFSNEDEDEEKESSSPGEHTIPDGRNVANVPISTWTLPKYSAFR